MFDDGGGYALTVAHGSPAAAAAAVSSTYPLKVEATKGATRGEEGCTCLVKRAVGQSAKGSGDKGVRGGEVVGKGD